MNSLKVAGAPRGKICTTINNSRKLVFQLLCRPYYGVFRISDRLTRQIWEFHHIFENESMPVLLLADVKENSQFEVHMCSRHDHFPSDCCRHYTYTAYFPTCCIPPRKHKRIEVLHLLFTCFGSCDTGYL